MAQERRRESKQIAVNVQKVTGKLKAVVKVGKVKLPRGAGSTSTMITSRIRGSINKIVSYLKLVGWVLKVAEKPDPEQFKVVLRLTLLLVLSVGLYAFVVYLVRYIVFMPGRLVALTPPYNYVLVGVIVSTILGIGLYLFYSFRKTVKEVRKGK